MLFYNKIVVVEESNRAISIRSHRFSAISGSKIKINSWEAHEKGDNSGSSESRNSKAATAASTQQAPLLQCLRPEHKSQVFVRVRWSTAYANSLKSIIPVARNEFNGERARTVRKREKSARALMRCGNNEIETVRAGELSCEGLASRRRSRRMRPDNFTSQPYYAINVRSHRGWKS